MEKNILLSDVEIFPGTEKNGLLILCPRVQEFESNLTVLNAELDYRLPVNL